MTTRLGLGNLRGLIVAAPLIPAFFVMGQVGPDGFPDAWGCSGSGSGVAAPALVSLVDASPGETLAVATDAFVVLNLSGYFGLGELATQLDVEVKTSAGAVVPGSLKLLQDLGYTRMVGWQAAGPQAIGSKLTLLAKAHDYPSAVQAQLEVAGPPTELSAETLMFGQWVKFGHGVGDPATCQSTSGGGCQGPTLTLPGAEQQLQAVHTTWTPPPVTGFVAWRAHVELPGGEEMIRPSAQQLLFRQQSQAFNLGSLVFPPDTTEHCAELVVEDLRTGAEQRKKLCAEPQTPTGPTERDYPLSSCSAPPTGALEPAWCETNAGDPRCGDSPRDPAPQEPMPQEPMPQPPAAQEPNPKPEAPSDTNAAADDGARTSSGCQMPRGVPSSSGFALLLALGGFVAARLRAARGGLAALDATGRHRSSLDSRQRARFRFKAR